VGNELKKALKGISPLYIKPSLDMDLLAWLLRFALKCSHAHMRTGTRAKFEILTYSIPLLEALLAQPSMACDFEQKGLLMVYKNRENFENFGTTNAFLERFNLGCQRIEKDQLHAMEPALSHDMVGAWINPSDWHLRPDMLMAAWRNALAQKGVIMEEQCRFLNFDIKGRTITGVNTTRGNFRAAAVVLATGAWAPETVKQLKLNLPIQPGKGYSITMERPGLCPTHACSLAERKVVVTPWKSGYRLGGTMEFSGNNNYLNPKRLDMLIAGAKAYLKEPLGHPVIEEWTGMRPMTYDDLPIIDWAPNHDNLVVAAGHGMLGVTLATGTGKIVSDMILDRQPQINIQPFGMARFN
jgi:D-amino-acid dehydrogenase